MKKIIEQDLSNFSDFLNQGKSQRLEILSYLRDTSLPFIACHHGELTPKEQFNYSFQYLHLLGQYNLPLAIGLSMNQYIAFSIGCLPATKGTPLHALKHEFMSMVKNQNWLLAVSSFDDIIRNKDESTQTVNCTTQDDGSIVCRGIKNFQSNISQSDVLLFSAILDNKSIGLFFTPLKETPGIQLGDPVFIDVMNDSDTRAVRFNDVVLQAEQAIPASDENQSLGLHALTRVVFSVMAMSPYLGAAKRALDEASDFLNNVHVDDAPLASLDGYITDMGRAHIKYQICNDLIDRFTDSVSAINEDNLMQWVETETPKSLALKYHVTKVCEELVSFSRKIIGTRSMSPNHILSKISTQICFGALHPIVNAKVERQLGSMILNR